MAAAGLGALLLLLLLLLAAPCAGQRHGEPGGWEGAREREGREEGPQHPTRAERARPGVPHRCGALWVSVRVTM